MLVSSGSTNRLEKTAFVSQEALSVGVKDGHQAHLGNIEALTQKVDADDDVDVAEAKGVDDLGSLNGVNFRMQVVRLDPHAIEVSRHLFGELDGHDRHQASFPALNAQVDFCQQVVDLAGRGTNLDFGVEQPRGAQLHFGDALDALQHVVHRFGLGMLFGQIRLTCATTARGVKQPVGDGLSGDFAEVAKLSFARRG